MPSGRTWGKAGPVRYNERWLRASARRQTFGKNNKMVTTEWRTSPPFDRAISKTTTSPLQLRVLFEANVNNPSTKPAEGIMFTRLPQSPKGMAAYRGGHRIEERGTLMTDRGPRTRAKSELQAGARTQATRFVGIPPHSLVSMKTCIKE